MSKCHELPGNPTDEAIRGFFIFRGAVKNESLPSFRFHKFFKYIEGLWGELQPDNSPNGPIGEVSYQPEEVSSDGQHKMLELLRCECCGELFIGGNRKELSNYKIEMTLNDPNLDRIPNMQATPMVQNKSVEDYAIFWPTKVNNRNVFNGYLKNPSDQDYYKFGVVDNKGNHTLDNGNGHHRGAWRKAYLNPFDGSVAFSLSHREDRGNYIQGFLYFPKSDNNPDQLVTTFNGGGALKALPCKCPACGKDYLYRKYMQSPIRSFRTGMGRNNQLLSKELLYQLDPNDNNKSKLIGFSDSRQDAAEQSKLIAREHYRDMVRLLFIQLVDKNAQGGITEDLKDAKDDIISDLNKGKTIDKIISKRIKDAGLTASEENDLTAILRSNEPVTEKIANVDAYQPRVGVLDLNKMISAHPNMIDGDLVSEMLKLGINPAGTEHADMYPLGTDFWDTYYDFDEGQMKADKYGHVVGNTTLGKIVYQKLQSTIFTICFGQYMNVNTESAGLGYVLPRNYEQDNDVIALGSLIGTYLNQHHLSMENFLSAFIRIFGDNYRYRNDDFGNERNWPNYDGNDGYKASIRNYVKEIAEQIGVEEIELGIALNNALHSVATDNDSFLKLSKPLRFKLAHNGDPFFKCPRCGRVHLHRGTGFCTNLACRCALPEEPSGNVEDLWKGNSDKKVEPNYISYDVKVQPHEAKRLHSEELTGQTDDQMTRLLQFKDINLDPEHQQSVARNIDMLCVTTTMEVGVDIGSLQAIYQGNMPPTRYNYQQRVGRAGRRGQAFSAAVTFCRGRSHDNYYYYNATEEMTGGIPASPTIAVNPCMGSGLNLVIVKRIILKHILMLISANRADWAIRKGSTVGQLGETGSQTGDWDNNVRPVIKEWIDNHQEDICHIIKYYLAQYLSTDKLEDVCKSLLAWINNEVLPLMDEAISSSSSTDNAQAIAEAGLLPLYGMPTSIRSLYHNAKRSRNPHNGWTENITGKIERPIDQAITDFAPGAIKTKDSAEYKVAGLTVPLDYLPQFDNENELKEHSQDLDPLQYSYNLTVDAEGSITSIGRYDPNQIKEDTTYRLVIPKAFRTDKIVKNDGSLDQNEDSRSNYTPVSIWVDAQSQHQTPVANGAGRWEAWNGDHQKAIIWTVNDNNRDFFTGHRAWKSINVNEVTEPIFFKHDVSDQLKERLKEYAPNFMIDSDVTEKYWQPANETQKIALGTKKVTDTLCLSLDPNKIPSTLCLDALHGNRAAIVAAFYSAATLIQRTFADQIDIDPQEIEISEVKIDEITGLSSVYLNDKAPNGAGFISLLCSNDKDGQLRLEKIMKDIVSPSPESKFIKHIISDEHKKSCVTSCPKCLNTFYNRGLHHVLDWRLGMDVIKLMLDNHYEMGFHNLKETPYGDLPELMNEVGIRVSNAFPDKSVNYVNNDGTDWHSGMFRTRANGIWKIEHLVHPLWNVYDQEQQDGYKAQNVFVLQRNVKMPPIEFEPDPNRQALGAQIDQSQAPTDNSNSSDDGYGSLG